MEKKAHIGHWPILLAVFFLVHFFLILGMPGSADPAKGFSTQAYKKFQAGIKDYRKKLNPKFRKRKRKTTQYIIIHTSELGLSATLRVVSDGKQFKSGYKTPGGHAHYVIARNGKTYRILDKQYRADHAGLSMWKGRRNVSSRSIGIELVGYHYAPITSKQYRSVAMLIDILQNVYGLNDTAVLTHSQVAFGPPNPWFKRNHRGRKRCAKNFERSKAGLGPTLSYDPDVRAGRLQPDPQLAALFYGKEAKKEKVPVPRPPVSNIIAKNNSAWSIAGEDYNQPTTLYILPDNRALPGDRIGKILGWQNLPQGTRVLLNQNLAAAKKTAPKSSPTTPSKALPEPVKLSPIKEVTDSMTAWSHAGPAYKSATTIYFLPSGKILPGSKIADWDDLPVQTRLIVGYKGPFNISKKKTPYKIAGQKYRDQKTIYILPEGELRTGNEMKDFTQLPIGTGIYLPL